MAGMANADPGDEREGGHESPSPRIRGSQPPPGATRRSRGSTFGRFLQRTPRDSTRLRGVAGAAGIVAFGFILSRVLGLARSVAIADAFGTDPELSAWWVAFRLPDLVFQVLAGATLSAAFIPVFSRVLLRHGEAEAWRLASSVLNLVALATFVLAAVAFALAPVLVPWLAPELGVEAGREDELKGLAVELTRYMLISPLLFGISGMITGILNARQHFIAPALAPAIYNLAIIGGAVFLAGPFGIHGLVWGVVLGSLGHLLIQAPALRAVGMRWSPSLDVFSTSVHDVLRLMGPRVIGLASTQVNLVALVFFASFVSDEAISAINYAFLMMMLPIGVVGMAIATAAFPTLAQHAAAGESYQLRASLTRALRAVLFLALPASIGLLLLAEPGVRVLLERGAFDAGSTRLVTQALQVFAIGVLAHSGVEILSRGFYALADTRTPVTIAVISMALNIALAAVLIGPLELRGLAAALTIAGIVEFAVLVVLLHRRLGGFEALSLRRTVWSTIAGSLVLAQAILIALLLLGRAGVADDTTAGALLRIVIAGGLGTLAFVAVTYVIHREDYAVVTARLRR